MGTEEAAVAEGWGKGDGPEEKHSTKRVKWRNVGGIVGKVRCSNGKRGTKKGDWKGQGRRAETSSAAAKTLLSLDAIRSKTSRCACNFQFCVNTGSTCQSG